tara:strand:+ start:90 stop:563 length:474 start_codon:yes stop_codon:yes gene_type:complete
MSKVIKNNDGVAVVEGTPAASLVKDVDKFFASKPPERMAGESISQPRKLVSKDISRKSLGRRPSFERLSAEEQAEVTASREKQMEERRERATGKRPVSGTVVKKQEPSASPRRNEARKAAESRRQRFFERRRSKKEAERSQTEQESTQGKFVTTLKT